MRKKAGRLTGKVWMIGLAMLLALGSFTIPVLADEGAEEIVLFEDGFESGDLSYRNSNFKWNDGGLNVNVEASSDIARTGTHSVKFTYEATPSGEDSWSELRYDLPTPREEVWFQWFQYYPDGTEGLGPKWNHRRDSGVNNNKFFLVGNKDWPAGGHSSFNHFTFETEPSGSSGDSRSSLKWRPNGAASGEYGITPVNGGVMVDDSLRGRWVEYIAHFKVSSGWQQYDSVAELWVDGVQIHDHRTLNTWMIAGGAGDEAYNIFNSGYVMGWANSGFDQESYTYIDDFKLLSTPPAGLDYDPDDEGPAYVINECAAPREEWIFCDDFESDRRSLYYDFFNRWGRLSIAHTGGLENSGTLTSLYGHYAGDGIVTNPQNINYPYPGNFPDPYGTWAKVAFGKTPDNNLYKPAGNPDTVHRELNWRFFVKNNTAADWSNPDLIPSTGPLARVYGYGPSGAPFMSIDVGYPDASGTLTSELYTGEFDGNGNPTGSTLATTLVGTTPIMHHSLAGEWHMVEIRAKLNDPGQSNGSYELWINDKLESKQSGINWAGSYTDFGINAVEIYNTNNEIGVPGGGSESRVFDNLIVSTKPIGRTGLIEDSNSGQSIVTVDNDVKLVGQQLEITASVADVEEPFTTLIITIDYDPNKLEFDTVLNDYAEIADSAIESLLPNFGISSALRESEGQIRIILATAGNANAVSGNLPLFKLHGQVKEDAAVGATVIALSELELSMNGDIRTLDVSKTSAEIQIILSDKAGLHTVIQDATQVHGSAAVGTSPGQYPASAVTTLWNAIQAANTVYSNAQATQTEVNEAITALQTAVSTFQQSVIVETPVDLSGLQSAIAAAQNKLVLAGEGSKLGQYPQAAIDALSDAIDDAKSVRNNGSASQSAVNAAITTLELEIQSFSSDIITFVKDSTEISIRDLSILAGYYGAKKGDINWSEVEKGDLIGDEEITIDDIAAVARMILGNWAKE